MNSLKLASKAFAFVPSGLTAPITSSRTFDLAVAPSSLHCFRSPHLQVLHLRAFPPLRARATLSQKTAPLLATLVSFL